jgi:S-DNA-T family DNA segregation ATPase FtsK/SpoIIIE
VRSDDLAPLVVEPAHAAGAFLVAGPPRSGRSTALASIAAQLTHKHVVALCARRHSALRERSEIAFVGDPRLPDHVERAVAAVADNATLLVDDVDLIDDIAALTHLEDAVRMARDGCGFVVLAGTTDAMTSTFRGPVAQARRNRAGLLLRPEGGSDGELFGVKLRRRSSQADPPGRGLLAINGTVVPVQVPDPS